jgi:hypothetical protein
MVRRVRCIRARRDCYAQFCWALALAFTLGELFFSCRFSTFLGDDLTAFWSIHTMPPGRYLTSLLGGQLVVLHRALTWLVHAAAPMRFSVALSILGALHLTGVL